MLRLSSLLLVLLMACQMQQLASAQNIKPGSGKRVAHGHMRHFDNRLIVWDSQVKKWVSPSRFWSNYTRRTRAKYWGRMKFYPPYRRVKEHDLVLIETARGTCLMEFYHRRWRRANDVWRWDKGFNQYGGCSNVHRQRSSLFERRKR